MKNGSRSTLAIGIIIVVAVLLWYTKFAGHHLTLNTDRVPNDFWGATFSKKYAQELGVNWREAYLAMLDDLKIKNIRIPVYWDDVEVAQGRFEFASYDWMLQKAEERDVSVILVAGRRLPRWPECHQPAWTDMLSEDEIDREHIAATERVIRHFRAYESIEMWQLENEYFFPWFGECPKAKNEIIEEEIDILRDLDDRPLLLTDSGELNSWKEAAAYADVLGTTMYRVVWNNYFGYFRAPWPAILYRAKASFAGKDVSKMIVAELQAEPWPAHFMKVQDITSKEADKSFSLRQFETNAELARRTGFEKAYFWGVEWWYWLKEQGDDRFWERAKEIISTDR